MARQPPAWRPLPEARADRPQATTVSSPFHVVIPSIPGYGFSDRPTGPGWNAERTTDAWGVLMQLLLDHR